MSALGGLCTRTRIEGLVILLIAAGYLWEGHNVPDFYRMPGVPGPTVFPLLLGIVFALSGLWLIVNPARGASDAARPEGTKTTKAEGASVPAGLRQRLVAGWHTCAMWGAILAYLFVMPELGFPVATAIVLAVFLVLLGETRWPVVAAIALGATLLIYAAFALGLNVRLPLGVLASVLK